MDLGRTCRRLGTPSRAWVRLRAASFPPGFSRRPYHIHRRLLTPVYTNLSSSSRMASASSPTSPSIAAIATAPPPPPPPVRSSRADLVLNLLAGSAGGAAQVVVGQPLYVCAQRAAAENSTRPEAWLLTRSSSRPAGTQSRPARRRRPRASLLARSTSRSRRSRRKASSASTRVQP